MNDKLKTEFAKLDLREALKSRSNILLGVSQTAADALKLIGVESVFDLASSHLFTNANRLLKAGLDPTDTYNRFGIPPKDVVHTVAEGRRVDELLFEGIGILEGLDETTAKTLEGALDVITVRDLALWPPYLAACQILIDAYLPELNAKFDLEAPTDLLPKSGEYPTERLFYTTLVFDGYDGYDGEVENLQPLERTGTVDLVQVAKPDFGFKKPGIGALLTMSQSWYAQGVALGQLLHSIALAPGESTRIAMLDWSRRTVGKQSEDVTETESISNITEHGRALSEVTSAVAQEAQSGFSDSSVTGHSSQEGSGVGIGLGPITIGDSSGKGDSSSHAMSFSSSSGHRDLSASMVQNVVDRTQQYANATRNRRATVVREVSQSEHETVSTRVVTNYNHMHALSIQYYEIVQIYRVTVQLSRIEKCLFIPISIDFSNHSLYKTFRKVLANAAIDEAASAMLASDYDLIEIKNHNPYEPITLENAFGIPKGLLAHLESNRRHYSQAIINALDPATLTMLLSGYSYGGRPVSTLVNPQPVTTAGNYLVFKTHVTTKNLREEDDQEGGWAQWLDEHGVNMNHIKEDLVPLPSGGVFAEAVLGRYNSAEKLDITRFWNWQDSPIPIQAPEIAPVQLTSLAQPEDLKAGSFSQPLVNIVNPTSLPDPHGLTAALQAIANGNMFRDMSGLASTIGLAQAGLQTTSDAATAANIQAGSNLATAAKKEVEMFKAALAFASMFKGIGGADTSPSTISNEGAKINHGRSMDARGASSGSNSGGSNQPSVIGGGNSGGSQGGSPIPQTVNTNADMGNEEKAFNKALYGVQGASNNDIMNNLLPTGSDITPTGNQDEVESIYGTKPSAERLIEIRDYVKRFIRTYVPSYFEAAKDGDLRFLEIINHKDYSANEKTGTTCGHIAHFLLWSLGCATRLPSNSKDSDAATPFIVNRSVPPFTYTYGQNITRIYNNGVHPFKNTWGLKSPLKGDDIPSIGDILFITYLDGSGEHVFICMECSPIIKNNELIGMKIEAAQAGQGLPGITQFADYGTYNFKFDKSVNKYKGVEKYLQGWLPLKELEFSEKSLNNKVLPE